MYYRMVKKIKQHTLKGQCLALYFEGENVWVNEGYNQILFLALSSNIIPGGNWRYICRSED